MAMRKKAKENRVKCENLRRSKLRKRFKRENSKGWRASDAVSRWSGK